MIFRSIKLLDLITPTWNSGLIVLRSLDMMRGAAKIAQMAIWTLDWSRLSPKFPMINWKSQKYPSVFKRKSINIWQYLKIEACIKNCSKFKICKLHIKLWCRYFWQLKSKRGRKVTFSWALNFWSVRSLFDRNTFTVDGIRTLFDL